MVVTSRTEKHSEAETVGARWVSLEEALRLPTIIYAVPISELEPTIIAHLPYFTQSDPKTIIDVLSVKCHARDILTKYLPKDWNILLTHPMFGPDSVRVHGVKNLPIVMDGSYCSSEEFSKWREIFTQIGLQMKEMTCEEHDKYAAESQGVTHFIGRTLEDFGMKKTPIDTVGAEKLLEVTDQVCHDTWQLFLDLQRYNPYTKHVRKELRTSLLKTYDAILPQKSAEDTVVIGIQ